MATQAAMAMATSTTTATTTTATTTTTTAPATTTTTTTTSTTSAESSTDRMYASLYDLVRTATQQEIMDGLGEVTREMLANGDVEARRDVFKALADNLKVAGHVTESACNIFPEIAENIFQNAGDTSHGKKRRAKDSGWLLRMLANPVLFRKTELQQAVDEYCLDLEYMLEAPPMTSPIWRDVLHGKIQPGFVQLVLQNMLGKKAQKCA
jgi:hypothetical protein